jgi:hypothetical protein
MNAVITSAPRTSAVTTVPEASYLAVVAAFAEDSAVTTVTIREPQVVGVAHFGVEPPIDGYGLAGLFPADLSGYHDGAG